MNFTFKIILTSYYILLNFLISFSQEYKIDSLINSYNNSTNYDIKTNLLLDILKK